MNATFTAAKEWRSGVAKQLPSGFTARLRKPDLLRLIKDPNAPDFITSTLLAGMRGQETKVETDTLESVEPMTKALDWICLKCFVQPRIVEVPDGSEVPDDAITLDDISTDDKMAVLSWAMGKEGADAATFREGSVSGVGAVADGEELQPAPQSNTGTTE